MIRKVKCNLSSLLITLDKLYYNRKSKNPTVSFIIFISFFETCIFVNVPGIFLFIDFEVREHLELILLALKLDS